MLNTKPNIEDVDGFYAELLAMQDGHREEARRVINARLILILANHIGDRKTLSDALALAENVLAP